MNQLQERIAQFRKMATDDPENELGHYRLGQLLMEDNQLEDAVKSFRRTLELSPTFSKVYQLLGASLIKVGQPEEAIKTLTEGYAMADQRGDNVPREEMSKMLVELGQPAPVSTRGSAGPRGAAEGDGFHCQRPGCPAGPHARQLAKPPMNDELGKQIYEGICAECWEYWLKNLSIKVINEMRLDLSTERGQEVYDQMMRETLGLEASPRMNEYLVSHGKIGGVGRFLTSAALVLTRGTRVVVESPRGLEVGAVLCPATPRHARMLPATVVGRLLRSLEPEDEVSLKGLEERGHRLFEDARRLGRELAVPVEILDVDLMFDGRQAIVQYLQAGEADLTAFVEELQERHQLVVLLENLAVPAEPEEENHAGGCGEPNCGKKDGGGCTSCSTGGGCSSCGTGKVDMAAYFGHLRTKMEETNRVPLL